MSESPSRHDHPPAGPDLGAWGAHYLIDRPLIDALQRRAESDAGAGTPAPAAWYPDPTGTATMRWWDGTRWTDHTA